MSVPSPCIQVCAMDDHRQLCKGCWRTLDEIAAWSALGNAEKLLVWKRIRMRKAEQAPAMPDNAESGAPSSA